MKRLLAALLFATPLFAAEPATPSGTTTIVLVRHAEVAPGDNPGLSDAGQQRARDLAAVVADAGIRKVYHTEYRRTKDTASALPADKGIRIVEVPAGKGKMADEIAEQCKTIVADDAGTGVLIIGHSNTIPMFVEALTGVKVPPIEHAEFDRLYIVERDTNGRTRLIVARYGIH
jgi:broad specificity phosphatase PhoE